MKSECFGFILCCCLSAAFPGDQYSVKEITSASRLTPYINEQNPISKTYVTSTSDNKNNEDETSSLLTFLKKYQKTDVKNIKENDFNLQNVQNFINRKGNKTTKVYKITITKIDEEAKRRQTSNDNHESANKNEVKVLPVQEDPKEITKDATEQKYTEGSYDSHGKTIQNNLPKEHSSIQMDVAQGGVELSKEKSKLSNSVKLNVESEQTKSPQSKNDSVHVKSYSGSENHGLDRSSYVRSSDDSVPIFAKKSQDNQFSFDVGTDEFNRAALGDEMQRIRKHYGEDYINLQDVLKYDPKLSLQKLNQKDHELSQDQKSSSFDINRSPLLGILDDYPGSNSITESESVEYGKKFVEILKLLHILNILPEITNISKTVKSDSDYINTGTVTFPKRLLQLIKNPHLVDSVEELKSVLGSVSVENPQNNDIEKHAYVNKDSKVFLTYLQKNIDKIRQNPNILLLNLLHFILNSKNKFLDSDSNKLFIELLKILEDLPTEKSESYSQKLLAELETVLRGHDSLPKQQGNYVENQQFSLKSFDPKSYALDLTDPIRNFKKVHNQNDDFVSKSDTTLRSILRKLLRISSKDYDAKIFQENRPSEVSHNLDRQSVIPVQSKNKIFSYPQTIFKSFNLSNDVNTFQLAKDTINKSDSALLQKLIDVLNVVLNNEKWDNSIRDASHNRNHLPLNGVFVNLIEKQKSPVSISWPKFDKSITYHEKIFPLGPTNDQIDDYKPGRRQDVTARNSIVGDMLSPMLGKAPKEILRKPENNVDNMLLGKLSDLKDKTPAFDGSFFKFLFKTPNIPFLKLFLNVVPYFRAGINSAVKINEIATSIGSLLPGFTEKSLNTCQQEANAEFLMNMLHNITSYLLLDNCKDGSSFDK